MLLRTDFLKSIHRAKPEMCSSARFPFIVRWLGALILETVRLYKRRLRSLTLIRRELTRCIGFEKASS